MTMPDQRQWVHAAAETIASYRRMIDATVAQLTDDELIQRPAAGMNSVAVLLRHLGGNLRSRWTDFLTTDGEKPHRDRESEFADWTDGRAALLSHLDAGWDALSKALEQIREMATEGNPGTVQIQIRGESHSLPQALWRSITHISYHVGQISMIGRMVHVGDWQWLTVAPGKSAEHNRSTWGTSASRSVFAAGDGDDARDPESAEAPEGSS